MGRRIDLSYGKAARLGTALLVTMVLTLGLAAVPAEAGHGNYRYRRAQSTRVVYASTFSGPRVYRTAFVAPRRSAFVYRRPVPYVVRSSPVLVTRTFVPTYRTTRFYRTTPVYVRTPLVYRSSRFVSYPGYYSGYDGAPLYRNRRSVARDVLTVAAGAGVGAVTGGLLGGKRGAVIGAVAGSIGGAAIAAASGGRY